jgi:SAM-dependent methyltransferase
LQEKKCPYCNENDLKRIDSKFGITTLFECENCKLRHRHPKDSEKYLMSFYQEEYDIDQVLMTNLPDDNKLERLKENNFSSERDYEPYLSALFSNNVKLIDYGCSWGYNVYKMSHSGNEVVGYEPSRPRAEFGMNKLGVKIYSDLDNIPDENDLVLSSHVIEHLNDISSFKEFAKDHLKQDGVFMAFCPNGNDEYRQREPEIWHGSWGDIHVNLIDAEFAKVLFKNNPYLIMSGDWKFDFDEIKRWDGISQKIDNKLDGKELLIISRPNIRIT